MNTIYIAKPHFIGLDKTQLHYADVLTYVALRSFKNSHDNNCFPSYDTVAERMNVSRSFVAESIKRLILSDYISKIKHYNTSNRYYFRNRGRETKIPPQVLGLDLTMHEKAMLIILKQFCEGDPISLFKDVAWIATQLGITYKTVYTQVKGLIEKGYLEERITRFKKVCGYKLTSSVDWYFVWDFPEKRQSGVKEPSALLIT